jgi:DNA-binding NtrC family response regulator
VFYIDLPTLDERGDDVELLTDHFLERLNERACDTKHLSSTSRAFLHEYTWPGNVRELFNTVQRAFIIANDELDIAAAVASGPRLDSPAPSSDKRMYFRPGMSLAEMERIAITETVRSANGNKTRAAAMLGISVKTLYNKLNEYHARDGL